MRRRPLGIAGLLSGGGAVHRKSQGCWAVKRCPLGIAGLLGGGGAVRPKGGGAPFSENGLCVLSGCVA